MSTIHGTRDYAEWLAGRPVVLVIPNEKRSGILDALRELREQFYGD